MGLIVTAGQAMDLLVLSEQHGGHPCVKHISISNSGLMERLLHGEGGSPGGVIYISAFLTLKDAGEACRQVLKNLGKGVVKRVSEGESAQRDFTDVRTDRLFRARFAFGGAGVRTYDTDRMTLVIRHKPLFPHGIMIVTFFPRPPNELRLDPI